MSAPDTNTPKQARRHKPALWGIAVALTVAGALVIAYTIYIAAAGQTPGDADVKIDGRTGEEVVIEE